MIKVKILKSDASSLSLTSIKALREKCMTRLKTFAMESLVKCGLITKPLESIDSQYAWNGNSSRRRSVIKVLSLIHGLLLKKLPFIKYGFSITNNLQSTDYLALTWLLSKHTERFTAKALKNYMIKTNAGSIRSGYDVYRYLLDCGSTVLFVIYASSNIRAIERYFRYINRILSIRILPWRLRLNVQVHTNDYSKALDIATYSISTTVVMEYGSWVPHIDNPSVMVFTEARYLPGHGSDISVDIFKTFLYMNEIIGIFRALVRKGEYDVSAHLI